MTLHDFTRFYTILHEFTWEAKIEYDPNVAGVMIFCVSCIDVRVNDHFQAKQ
jgi:hypothetical protein